MKNLDKKDLVPIGKGTYNHAFSYTDGFGVKQVVKIPKADKALSQPARAVRIWNEVHDEKTVGIATECKVESKSAWMCPFIEEDEKSQCQDNGLRDLQLSAKLVEVFKKTGRIVFDIMVKGNVTGGELVDVDQALKLPGRGRRGSDASINFFEKLKLREWRFIKHYKLRYPKTFLTIALLLKHYTEPVECDNSDLFNELLNDGDESEQKARLFELDESIRDSKTSQKQAQNKCASSVAENPVPVHSEKQIETPTTWAYRAFLSMLVVAVVMCIDIGWKCIVANFLVDFWMMSAVSAVAVNFVVILALLAIGIYGLDLCSDQQMTLPKGPSSARSQAFTQVTSTDVNELQATRGQFVTSVAIFNL